MSYCEDDLRVNKRSSALVDVSFDAAGWEGRFENGHHPGKLAVLRFVILEVGNTQIKSVSIPHSARRHVCGARWRLWKTNTRHFWCIVLFSFSEYLFIFSLAQTLGIHFWNVLGGSLNNSCCRVFCLRAISGLSPCFMFRFLYEDFFVCFFFPFEWRKSFPWDCFWFTWTDDWFGFWA